MTDNKAIEAILKDVAAGLLPPDEAMKRLQFLPFDDIDYAKVDYHRELRSGAKEVIFCMGKTPEQVRGIAENMKKHGLDSILGTRADKLAAKAIIDVYPDAVYYEGPKLVMKESSRPKRDGMILVVTGGTADIPVAEEAALTAEYLGNRVERLYDVGVAGLHRLLSHLDVVGRASVIIAVAGMEGALASVVGGLTDKPVVAVPTSIGYGANFFGLAALLSMLNSCSAGIGVVNIDNGFGAGFLANNINRLRNEH